MNFTDEQIEKQYNILPDEVQDNLFTPELERKVQTAGVAVGLLINQIKELNALVNFVILGLIPEKEFAVKCQESFKIEAKDAEELSQIISREIFIPMEEIRVVAIKKHEEEEAEDKELFGETSDTVFDIPRYTPDEAETKPEEVGEVIKEIPAEPEDVFIYPTPVKPQASEPTRTWEKTPDAAPENLPTDEVESFLPNLVPKTVTPAPTSAPETETHPFEEKMKKVFTAGQQSMGELTIEQATPQTPKAPPVYHTDPYREPIE